MSTVRVPAGVPAGDQFAASAHAESGVSLAEPAAEVTPPEWVIERTVATSDPERRAAVTALTDALDRLIRASNPRDPWISGDGLTCDGGALATSLIASRLGIPNMPVVGLYWHSDPELRADLMGEYQGDDETDEDWQANLDHIERTCMDEHHHWVVLWPDTDHAALWDPNGEVRDEPHLQDEDDPFVRKRYEEITAGEWRTAVWDPDGDPEDEARACYPGMVEAVQRCTEGPDTQQA